MHIEYNNLTIPESLNGKFFNKTLENAFGNYNFDIKEISFTMGSSAGDNYCSDIYRAKIIFTRSDGKLEKINLIIKSLPKVESAENLKRLQVYPKEKIMYFDVIPKINEILRNVKIAPRCYYTEIKPISTIVFEDLKELGYEVQDREIGLDENYAKILLQKLGKFHAATMVFARDNPELLDNFTFSLINPEMAAKTPANSTGTNVLTGNFKQIINMAQQWPGYDAIIEKFKKIEINFYQRMGKLLSQRGDINVLNHGDLWVNNVMFHSEDNQPLDVIFVDFQLGVYHSPALDLNYFFHTSLKASVLEHNREELIKVYHESLETTLEELKFSKIPTLDDIKAEMIEKDFYSVLTIILILPLITMKREHCKDNNLEMFTDVEQVEKKRNVMFSSERVIETVKYSLKRLDDAGVLDRMAEVQIN